MSSKKSLQGIVVRKIQFEFPEDFAAHWNPAKPEFSQLANGASPYMEDSLGD